MLMQLEPSVGEELSPLRQWGFSSASVSHTWICYIDRQ